MQSFHHIIVFFFHLDFLAFFKIFMSNFIKMTIKCNFIFGFKKICTRDSPSSTVHCSKLEPPNWVRIFSSAWGVLHKSIKEKKKSQSSVGGWDASALLLDPSCPHRLHPLLRLSMHLQIGKTTRFTMTQVIRIGTTHWQLLKALMSPKW